MKVVLLTYHGRHQKSYRLFDALLQQGCEVAALVAAPLMSLPKRPYQVQTPDWDGPTMEEAAESWGVPYFVAAHQSAESAGILTRIPADFALVGGARILPSTIIEAARGRVVNLHPARLPDIRGLDALKWSILRGVPPGVTAHWIDERVDAGRLILWRELPLSSDATIEQISRDLLGLQVALIPDVLRAAATRDMSRFSILGRGFLTRQLTAADEALVNEEFPKWRARWSSR